MRFFRENAQYFDVTTRCDFPEIRHSCLGNSARFCKKCGKGGGPRRAFPESADGKDSYTDAIGRFWMLGGSF